MARLPSVGGDNGQWGQILNDFLGVEHNADGTLKKAGDISAALSTANAAQVDAQNAQSTANSKYTKPGSGIPEADLDSSVQTKLNAGASGVPDATSSIKGKLQLAGDLTGTASSPQIAAGAVTDAKIAIGANIGQGKIQNLTSDLAARYVKPGTGIPAGDLEASIQTAISQATTSEQAANKGQAGGYASLDGAGKVPASQLPNAIMRYQGVWNASTNNPTLSDGSGDAGDVYRVTVAGAQNLGSGSISFNVGDYVVYNPSGVWEKSDTTDSVASVAGKTGVVSLDKNDVGLGNVPNTDATLRANHTGTQLASTISDFDSAADARIAAQKGALGGVATLDGTGKIPGTQLPALAITNTFAVNSQSAQLALAAQEGDLAIRSDLGKTYVHNGGTAGTMADWSELLSVGDQAGLSTKVSKSGDTMTGSLVINNAGGKNTLQLSNTGSNTGLTLGGDTTLYRQGTNYLRTDGSFMLSGNFTAQSGTGSGFAYISGTLTDTASTATLGLTVNTVIAPASASASEFRSLNMSANVTGAQNFTNIVKGAHLETRWQGAGGVSGWIYGAQATNIIPGAAPSFGTIANSAGLAAQGVTEFASTAITGTVTNAISVVAMANSRTNITVQNAIGIDVHSQTVGSGTNIGVRIAKSNTYALNLSDTGGTAAGGITFATDTTLYRSGANTLKTDNLFIGGAGLDANSNRITNVATPSNGTDAVNKDYADGRVIKGGDTMTGALTVNAPASTTSGNGTSQLSIQPSTSVSGASLLHFNIDRAWDFAQIATGAGTALALRALSSDKFFDIFASGTSTRALSVYTSTTTANNAIGVYTQPVPGQGALQVGSTATGGIALYNTADQATNYERFRMYWASSTFQLRAEAGGTGGSRNMVLGTSLRTVTIQESPTGNNGFFQFSNSTSSTASDIAITSTKNASSGIQTVLNIAPAVSQSATAGYTALLINPAETSTGSGTKLLADFQVSGTSRLSITNTGETSIASTATNGLMLYNTADQTTNYERVKMAWSSNTFSIVGDTGGTGTARNVLIGQNPLSALTFSSGNEAFLFSRSATAIATLMTLTTAGLTGSSGTQTGLQLTPVINQSATAGYTVFKVNPSQTATGSGTKLLADFQVGGSSKAVIDTNGYIGVGATSSIPTAPLTIGSTQAGNGIALFDTADQTTNYSRLRIIDTSNVFNIVTEWGGTGIARNLRIGTAATAGSVNSRFIEFNAAAPFYRFTFGSTGLTGNMIDMTGSTFSQASAQNAALGLNPTINQSGTAGYTMLLINPTETAIGSGSRTLIDAQVGGASQFRVGATGNTVMTGDLTVNTNRLVTAANGNSIGVGIGTATPTSASANRVVLHMQDTGNNGIEIRMNSTTVQARQFNNNSEFGFGTDTNHPIRFFVNGGGNSVLTLSTAKQADFAGKINAAAADTTQASIKIQAGVDPTSPVNGDIWFDGTNLKMRINGVTKTFTMT